MPAKRLLLDIARCNKRCKDETGDIDPAQAAQILAAALASPLDPRFLLEMGEYLAVAVDGIGLDPETWVPLEHHPHLK